MNTGTVELPEYISMSVAQNLANALHRFNAKERNHLMRFALLGETNPGAPEQSVQWVHKNFFEALRATLAAAPSGGGSDPQFVLSESARCVYAAMDYHLDWLHGALWETGNVGQGTPIPTCGKREAAVSAGNAAQYDVMGNQEDVDLMLVIEDGATAHLVFVEAKGDSAFADSQLLSKFRRLQLILAAHHVPEEPSFVVSLVLLAPGDAAKKAAERSLGATPRRIGNRIVPMTMPNFPAELQLVTRCNEEGKNPKGLKRETRHEDLTHWKIKRRRRPAHHGIGA